MRLRSVELATPQPREAAEFLEKLWGLIPVGTRGSKQFFRGTGDHPYIMAITAADAPSVRAIEFSGSPEDIEQTQAQVRRADVPMREIRELDAPGGGSGFAVRGPEAQTYRFIVETQAGASLPANGDKPIQLSHAVVNALDVDASERFAVDALGFKVSDRTRFMTFVRCNRKHHAIAYARAEVSSLNHIAFEMNDCDGVMRGIGRLRDAGHEPVWGPGRHGPGNNVFAYFAAPYGGVVEYTAEVSEVDESYKVGGPDDWQWPPGRTDHWGISRKDTARISEAERAFRFSSTLSQE